MTDSLAAKIDLAIVRFQTPETTKRTYTTKGFSYLLCVIGKLNVKLYELINNYHTDVCFQFHLINSMLNNVSHNKIIIRYTN